MTYEVDVQWPDRGEGQAGFQRFLSTSSLFFAKNVAFFAVKFMGADSSQVVAGGRVLFAW